jgi:hypothetical protein
MIERRYPIQTVLAERKMFAGGGAVLPQQMMPQQQQMMPPQQSGGILASSGPLLDAVAAGAINPDGDGGASLSDVQGFANGGLSTSQDLPYITRYDFENQIGGPSDRPDSRFLPKSGMTTDISAQLTGATDEQLRQFISSVDPITQGYVLSQAQTELDRRNSLNSLNTQPVNSLTPLYDFNDISDNAEDQAEGFSGQDQDPGGMTGPGFSNFSNQDPKTSFTISGIKESHPARSVTTNAQMAQYRAMKELEALAKGSAAATGDPSQDAVTETAAAVSMGIDSFDPDYMDETTTSITDAMDVGFDDSMGPSAGDPSDPTEDDDEDGAGSEDEGAAAADGGYFTSRMYNANSGQSGYPNMTAAEEIENGVQRFRRGGSIGPYNPDPRATYDNNSFLLDGQASTRIVPEQIANPQTVAEMMAAMSETGLDTSNADDISPGLMERIRNSLGTNDGSSVAGKGNLLNAMRYTASPSSFMGSTSSLPGQPIDENDPGTDPGQLVDVSWETNTPKPDLETMAKRAAFDDRSGRENTPIQTIEGFPTEKGTELTVSPVSAEAEAAVREAEVEGELVGGSQTVEVDPTVSSSESEVENETNRIQQSVVEEAVVGLTEASDKEDTKTGMTDFINDFKSAMPEYEGMSESEKGYAIMEAGLRIMAGKSSDALTNIAEGLKGLGPKFAKDAKDKRAWNRQIDLSAAKYALASSDKEKERLLAFAKSENDLLQVMNPETGDLKAITKADLRAGKIPKGYLVTKDPYKNFIDGIKATKALIVAQAAAKEKSDIGPKWLNLGKEYANNAQKVLDSVQSKTLLGPAISALFSTGKMATPVTGLNGVLNTSWNRLQNAIGLDSQDTMAKKGETRELYISRVQSVIAKKITAILGESNRTISTPDRSRADDIAGVFSDYLWDPAFKDPDILKDKIKVLWQTLENDERLGLSQMKFAEDSVGNLTVPGGGKFYRDVLREQRRGVLGDPVGVGPKGKVRKLSELGYNIETGVWAK